MRRQRLQGNADAGFYFGKTDIKILTEREKYSIVTLE